MIPEVIEPQALADYLEVIARAVFQAGVSWKQIAVPWDAYRAAFAGFDPQLVAAFDDVDVDRVLATPGTLRAPRKVRATIHNAAALLQADREFGGFARFLRAGDSYEARVREFKRRFTYVGDLSVWYILFRVGEPVPRFEPWVATIPGTHPRMREMVELARSQGRSREFDA